MACDVLYPKIEPYLTGYLKRDMHEVCFEVCGNPDGYPIVFVHGGPGAGCDADDRRFFDPLKWKIILFDQRGSGRSKPFGCIKKNTTRDLVGDMKTLLDVLGIKKAVFFGGSWGSTLSLLYAVSHPSTVSGLVLRGIWLGEKSEIDYYIKGGARMNFPDSWERFLSQVPKNYKNNPARYYLKRMISGTPKEREHFAYEWSRYELSMLYLEEKSDEELDKKIRAFPFVSLAIMEAHYCLNYLFIQDRYIMNRIEEIDHSRFPVILIQGRYDMVCPPDAAWRLSKVLRRAKLTLVQAGHSSSEPEIKKALVAETNYMCSLIQRHR